MTSLIVEEVKLSQVSTFNQLKELVMQELNINEVEQVSGGLSAERGAIAEAAIAGAAFAVGMTGVGLIATGAVLACVYLMDD